MNFQQLDILEQKIIQCLQLIESLRKENIDLREKIEQLLDENRANQDEIQRLKSKLDDSESNKNDNRFYQEREKEVRTKIENLLAKLEALELPI